MPLLRWSARQAGRDDHRDLSIPRRWKVIQTVREKFACRACETIAATAPFHDRTGAGRSNLLAMILDAKFDDGLPLNRQSETYARGGSISSPRWRTDWVRACGDAEPAGDFTHQSI